MNKKRVVGFLAAIGMVFVIAALSFESQRQVVFAEGLAKTFTIDGLKPVGENYLEDVNEGIIAYNQVTSVSNGTYISIDGDYVGTDTQTLEFNNPSYYLKGVAKPGMVASAQAEVAFGVKGLTSLSYNVTLTDEYEHGGNFYVQVTDKDSNVLATTSAPGSQTLNVPSGVSTSALIYFWGYGTYTFTSITFNYTCPAA